MAGLEHHGGPAHAARFEVDDAAYFDAVFRLRIHERLRAEQGDFLAIGQQEHHGPRRRVLFKVVRHFQPHRDADAVVAKARAGVHAVIVCGEHEGGAVA